MFGGWTMPAYFFRSEPGAAELRRLARGESGRVCQRVLMIANLLEGMEHEEAARLAGLSRSAAYEWHNRYEEEGIEGLHGGLGIEELCDWLIARTGATPEVIGVAIEMTQGPVVEALLERGFCVYGINPKQLDRFRDRFTVAGAKDDRRDAHVLGDSLRTDRHAFRRLSNDEPVIVKLREWSRMADDLQQERARLASRMREQLWRYYPQMLELADDLAADWFLDLWNQAPTPAKAAWLRQTTIERFVKAHRLRRWQAPEVLRILKQKPLSVAPGVVEAASDHIRTLTVRIRLVNQQLKAAHRKLDELCAQLIPSEENEPGQQCEQRDVVPAIHARARQDHPRRAARRGLAASAPARLSCLAQPVRSGPSDPPQRQNLRRR